MKNHVLIGLGRAVEVNYVVNPKFPQRMKKHVFPANFYFAWVGPVMKGSIACVRATSSADAKMLQSGTDAAKIHHAFHDTEGDIPLQDVNPSYAKDIFGDARMDVLGYVRNMVYHTTETDVPDSDKIGDPWRHWFGDFGDTDDKHNPKMWPAWVQRGHTMMIYRRPSNLFHLNRYVVG